MKSARRKGIQNVLKCVQQEVNLVLKWKSLVAKNMKEVLLVLKILAAGALIGAVLLGIVTFRWLVLIVDCALREMTHCGSGRIFIGERRRMRTSRSRT